jgi:hypothetical protein
MEQLFWTDTDTFEDSETGKKFVLAKNLLDKHGEERTDPFGHALLCKHCDIALPRSSHFWLFIDAKLPKPALASKFRNQYEE